MLNFILKRLHFTESKCHPKDRVCLNLFGKRYIFDITAEKGKQYIGWYKP